MVVDLLDDDALLDLRRRGRSTDPAAVIAEERRRGPALPQANESLTSWQATAKAAPTTPARPSGPALCPICTTRPGRQTCNACRRVVCPADVWTMLGLCKSCASAEDVAHWHRPAAPERDNWLGDRR